MYIYIYIYIYKDIYIYIYKDIYIYIYNIMKSEEQKLKYKKKIGKILFSLF